MYNPQLGEGVGVLKKGGGGGGKLEIMLSLDEINRAVLRTGVVLTNWGMTCIFIAPSYSVYVCANPQSRVSCSQS